MAISMEQVEYVADLARLALDEKEKQLLTEQLNKILDYANQLQELAVEDVPPTSHVLPLHNVLRKDEVRPWLTNEEALANAPDSADGQFRVPAVMEG